MNQTVDYPLERLQLRGQIAFAARCARRTFPLYVIKGGPLIREYDAAITMAESFAAGEPGDLSQARRVRDDVAVADLHIVAALAGAAVGAFSAVRLFELGDESDYGPLLDGDHPAIQVALRGSRQSARLSIFSLLDVSGDRALESLELVGRDFGLLGLSNRASEDFLGNPVPELGMGIDTSDQGPLGPLWEQCREPEWFKEGMDLWQKPVEMSVAPGGEFLSVFRSLKTFPDIVCWYLRPGAEAGELDAVELSMKQVESSCRQIGRIRPVLSVYAPDIQEDRRLRLIDLGATVYHVPLDNWFTPTDDESFSRLLQDRLQKSLRGLKSDGRGLWQRDDS